MTIVRNLTIASFIAELDEYFTREDLIHAFPPMLESLKELTPIESWGMIDSLIQGVYKHDFEDEDPKADMLFWEIVSEVEYQLLQIGTHLVPRQPFVPPNSSYELVEGYPALTWLGNRYWMAVEL